jgi:hypothetical protein
MLVPACSRFSHFSQRPSKFQTLTAQCPAILGAAEYPVITVSKDRRSPGNKFLGLFHRGHNASFGHLLMVPRAGFETLGLDQVQRVTVGIDCVGLQPVGLLFHDLLKDFLVGKPLRDLQDKLILIVEYDG